jgi:stage IV sporulation protein A
MDAEDVRHVFELLLAEFPVTELSVTLPSFYSALPDGHPLKHRFLSAVRSVAEGATKLGDVAKCAAAFPTDDVIDAIAVSSLHPESGRASLKITEASGLAFRVMSEICGREIAGEGDLFRLLSEYAQTAKAYARLSDALAEAEEKGYGIVMPSVEELTLDTPHVVKQMNGYGVRLHASAKSLHLIRASIETELSPTVGTEAETEELIGNLLAEFEEDPTAIWQSRLFGKSLYDLVGEGIKAKLAHMPEEARGRLAETLERIVNEGASGLVCILL